MALVLSSVSNAARGITARGKFVILLALLSVFYVAYMDVDQVRELTSDLKKRGLPVLTI